LNPVRNNSTTHGSQGCRIGRAICDSKKEESCGCAANLYAKRTTPRNQTLIDKVQGGFNNKDSALYNSAFGRDAVVIDGIAPYRWTGSNAQAHWFSDAEKRVHDFGAENDTIVCDKIVHAAVVGTYAYVVIFAIFFKLKGGQSGSNPGILTFTCAKQGDEWRVGSQAWARLS